MLFGYNGNMKICEIKHCDRASFSETLCRTHHRWKKQGRSLDAQIRPIKTKTTINTKCSVPNCRRWAQGNGFCRTCVARWKRIGGPLGPLKISTSAPDANGYMRWNVSHPNNKWGKQVYEHVAIMSLHLERDLHVHENVHHKNGNRLDNRLENLELWSTSQPPGQRVEDKIKWAKDILAIYDA